MNKLGKAILINGEKHYKKITVIILIVQCILLLFSYFHKGVAYEPDSETYIIPAKNFLSSGRMLDAGGNPIIFRTPGYSFFLAVVYLLAGYNDTVVVWLQMLMVLAITGMVFYLASHIGGKKLYGCFACFFYICDLPVYTHAVSILTDTVFPFLLILAFFLFYKYWSKHKIACLILSAISLNCAMLVRPQIIYLNMILVGVSIVLVLLKKIKWKECLVYCLIFFLAYGSWSFRNYCTYGVPMYSSVQAESYYKWFGPETYALDKGVTIEEANTFFQEMMEERYPDYETLSKIEQIYANKEVGGEYLKDHIPAYLLLNIKGLISEMIGPGMLEIYALGLPDLLCKLVGCVFAGLLLLSYLVYAVGFLRTIKKQKWIDWLILLTVMYLMASTAVLGYSRYRLAFYPLCLIGTFSCWKKRAGGVRQSLMGIESNNIEGVIVDLDGTLYFQTRVRLSVFGALLKHYAIHFWKWKQLYGIYLFRKIREDDQFRTTAFNQQLEYVSGRIGVSKEELDNTIQHWMFQFPLHLIEKYKSQEILSFLQEMQRNGKKIIVYSDYPVEEKLRCLGVKPDYIFYPGTNGITEMKPSTKAMEHILDTVGIKPGSLVFIGDRADKDGKSAELVRIPFILIHSGTATEERYEKIH